MNNFVAEEGAAFFVVGVYLNFTVFTEVYNDTRRNENKERKISKKSKTFERKFHAKFPSKYFTAKTHCKTIAWTSAAVIVESVAHVVDDIIDGDSCELFPFLPHFDPLLVPAQAVVGLGSALFRVFIFRALESRKQFEEQPEHCF